MRSAPLWTLIAAFAITAPAFANMGGSTPEPKQPASTSTPEATEQMSARQQAERWYGDAYSEIAKAKKDLEGKKEKNAEKRFKKALERAQRAVEIDSTYHEAWNLAGYAARKLGNYDVSLAAYEACLRVKFDYAPAREYLGEAYLELGKPDKAREQLALLERFGAENEASELKTAIDAYASAHPDAASGESAAPAAMESAPADTLQKH